MEACTSLISFKDFHPKFGVRSVDVDPMRLPGGSRAISTGLGSARDEQVAFGCGLPGAIRTCSSDTDDAAYKKAAFRRPS
jgi:hypothetical protein